MNLSYEINDVALFLNLKRYKDYYGANENRVNENSDYTLADLKVNYKFTKKLDAFIGVDNIQNKQLDISGDTHE